MERTITVNLKGAKPYKFTDKESGREVAGCNVFFELLDQQNNDEGKGFLPQKANLPYEAWDYMRSIDYPSAADAVLKDEFTSKGVRTKIVNFIPLKKAN